MNIQRHTDNLLEGVPGTEDELLLIHSGMMEQARTVAHKMWQEIIQLLQQPE